MLYGIHLSEHKLPVVNIFVFHAMKPCWRQGDFSRLLKLLI